MLNENHFRTAANPGPARSAHEPAVSGYCRTCRKVHRLQAGATREYCRSLMDRLEWSKSLCPGTQPPENLLYSTENLFGEARGKMIGVLEGIDKDGRKILLYAFSGQFNGCWSIPGWAPPLFDEKIWWKVNSDTERQIKLLTGNMTACRESTEDYGRLKARRKALSRQLMTRLHSLYTLANFRGETAELASFFPGSRGIPTGTGDCCAPKLLNYAVQRRILPIGLSEFYWGRTNRSGSRRHGQFYPPCTEKCLPLMGFLLCGLDEIKSKRLSGL